MQNITIYHNPRCSKSRQTLELLKQHDVDPEIVFYLETPPSKTQLRKLLSMLGIGPRELVRTGEAAYKEKGLNDPGLSDDQLLDAMLEEPRLIQRPIVTDGSRAVIGRPPQNVLELI